RGLESRQKMFPNAPRRPEAAARLKERIGDKLSSRLGWQPRCKPTVLPTGRILLPLYTDTFSISLMAISDDGGETWFAGKPLADAAWRFRCRTTRGARGSGRGTWNATRAAAIITRPSSRPATAASTRFTVTLPPRARA